MLKCTETAAQFVGRALQAAEEREDEASVDLRKVTVRVPEDTVAMLDFIGGKVRLSRTALAEELLVRAVQEAVCVVGVPSQDDGFQLELDAEAFAQMQAEKVAA
jgi:hypothetical protein